MASLASGGETVVATATAASDSESIRVDGSILQRMLDMLQDMRQSQISLEARLNKHERAVEERLDRLESKVDMLLSKALGVSQPVAVSAASSTKEPHGVVELVPQNAVEPVLACAVNEKPAEVSTQPCTADVPVGDGSAKPKATNDAPKPTPPVELSSTVAVDVLTVTAIAPIDMTKQGLDAPDAARDYISPFVPNHTDIFVSSEISTVTAKDNILAAGRAVGFDGHFGYSDVRGHKHTVFLWRASRFQTTEKGEITVDELPWEADGTTKRYSFGFSKVLDRLRNNMKLLLIGVKIGRDIKEVFTKQFAELTRSIRAALTPDIQEVYFFGDLNLQYTTKYRAPLSMVRSTDFGYTFAPEAEKASYDREALGLYVGAGRGSSVVNVRAEQFEVASAAVMRACPREGDPEAGNRRSDHPYQVRFTVRAAAQPGWSSDLAANQVPWMTPATLTDETGDTVRTDDGVRPHRPVYRAFTLTAPHQDKAMMANDDACQILTAPTFGDSSRHEGGDMDEVSARYHATDLCCTIIAPAVELDEQGTGRREPCAHCCRADRRATARKSCTTEVITPRAALPTAAESTVANTAPEVPNTAGTPSHRTGASPSPAPSPLASKPSNPPAVGAAQYFISRTSHNNGKIKADSNYHAHDACGRMTDGVAIDAAAVRAHSLRPCERCKPAEPAACGTGDLK